MSRWILNFLCCFVLFSCNQKENNTSKVAQKTSEPMEITKGKGMITKNSNLSFDETYNKLEAVIDNNPNLKIIAQLDHQANAASVGLKLNPTKIIMFGNPKLGTPLMQNAQTTGLDLPQKIMVWQDDNAIVKISYNAPNYLQERHGIENTQEVLDKISGALDKITSVAAGL